MNSQLPPSNKAAFFLCHHLKACSDLRKNFTQSLLRILLSSHQVELIQQIMVITTGLLSDLRFTPHALKRKASSSEHGLRCFAIASVHGS